NYIAFQLLTRCRCGQVFVNALAADLLFALDGKLELQRQLAAGLQPSPRAEQVRQHLSLVVGGAAGVDVAVTLGGLERRTFPFVQRLDRLHIVMAIHEHGWLAWHGWRLGINERMAGSLNDLRRQAHAAELPRYPIRRLADIVAAAGVGADAGDSQQ